MYVVIVPECIFDSAEENQKTLPEAYGPYETMNEAVGSAVDILQTDYGDELQLSFSVYGDNKENMKIAVYIDGKEDYYVTVNKLW